VTSTRWHPAAERTVWRTKRHLGNGRFSRPLSRIKHIAGGRRRRRDGPRRCERRRCNGRSAGSGWRIASAGRGVTAQRVSLSPAAAVALPVDALQAGGGIEGVAVRALDTPRAVGTTRGVALRAPGPPPPRLVTRTMETGAASTANPGTAICTDDRPPDPSIGKTSTRWHPAAERTVRLTKTPPWRRTLLSASRPD